MSLEQNERNPQDSFSRENEILKTWNLLPECFVCMKFLGKALLTMFGSTYNCEQLFSTMNFVKSNNRNRLSSELSAACVALKATTYEPRISKISLGLQEQISH